MATSDLFALMDAPQKVEKHHFQICPRNFLNSCSDFGFEFVHCRWRIAVPTEHFQDELTKNCLGGTNRVAGQLQFDGNKTFTKKWPQKFRSVGCSVRSGSILLNYYVPLIFLQECDELRDEITVICGFQCGVRKGPQIYINFHTIHPLVRSFLSTFALDNFAH